VLFFPLVKGAGREVVHSSVYRSTEFKKDMSCNFNPPFVLRRGSQINRLKTVASSAEINLLRVLSTINEIQNCVF
jgi:hypothetical protein